MNFTKQQISILGCGWLGFSLAQELLKDGFKIKGSTTNTKKLDTLNTAGIISYVVKISATTSTKEIVPALTNSKVVVINIPPGLRSSPDKNHVEEIARLAEAIEKAKVPHVIFVSSTSVYKNESPFPIFTEDTTPNGTDPTALQLKTIEAMLYNNTHFKTTVVRFGGLIGEERHPGKYLSGKKGLKNPEAPINLIHRIDAINIIIKIIKEDLWQETLNAVYPKHPSKASYYTNYSKQHGLPLPEFDNLDKSVGKIISSEKLVRLLNYRFKHSP